MKHFLTDNYPQDWRELNPDKKRYTWRRCHPLQQSRIDYFLLSKDLLTSLAINKVEIEPGVRSDHSAIILELAVLGRKRGPGLWRFNTSLLESELITDQLRSEIVSANNAEGMYRDVKDPGLLLELLLSNIRVHCIRQSISFAKERRLNERRLETKCKEMEELLNSSHSDQVLESYTEIKRELDMYKSAAAKRAMRFSKAKWLEEGERPTKYFLSLERKRAKEKNISVIQNEEGQVFTNDRAILKCCKTYYEKLHRSNTG